MNLLSSYAMRASRNTVFSTSVILASVFTVSGCKVDDVTQVVDEEVTEEIFVDVTVPESQSASTAMIRSESSSEQINLDSVRVTGKSRAVSVDDTVLYIPITTWYGPSVSVTQEKPGYYVEVIDDLFGTVITRVTQGGDHTYRNLRPVFNRDSSKFLLASGKIRNVIDGSLFGTLWNLSGMQDFKNPVWSKVDPDVVYGTVGLKFVSLDITTQEVMVIRDMAELDGFASSRNDIYMGNLPAISGDDEYVVFSDVANGGNKIVVIDIKTGEKRSGFDNVFTHPEFGVSVDSRSIFPFDVGISSSGDYIVIQGSDGHHLFDSNLGYIRKLADHQHADFAIDVEGDDSMVSMCPAKMERLSDGKITDLLGVDTDACGHINASTNHEQPGWAYLSINRDLTDVGTNGNLQDHEMVAVRLDPDDGTQVRRIIHPRITGDGVIGATVVPNADGTRVLFSSSWQQSGEVDSYIVDLTR